MFSQIRGRGSLPLFRLLRSSIPKRALPCTFALYQKTAGFSLAAETFASAQAGPYMEKMYEAWKKDRSSVHISWDAYFSNVHAGAPPGSAFQPPPAGAAAPSGGPVPAQQPVQGVPFFPGAVGTLPSAGSLATPDQMAHVTQSPHDTSRIIQMVRGYQTRGHELAQTDPLGLPRSPPFVPLARKDPPVGIGYKYYGFTESDLDKTFDCRVPGMTGFLSPERTPRSLREISTRLEETYCGSIGVEFMHITDQSVCNFLRQALETPRNFAFSPELKRKILVRTARAQLFEQFCATKFSTSKRFGLDGSETMIVGLKAMSKKAAKMGVDSIVIGMPHRGRLNMLMNVMHKPMNQMMAEFQGVTGFGGTEWGNTGDVKYHLGIEYDHWDDDAQRFVHMGVLANPSHLEAVNPLVVGQARAQQYYAGDKTRERVLPVTLHGDAAFAGQGVVYETAQMSRIPNYEVGGTLHLVVNNQVGFTTNPVDSGSGKYCTDLGKALEAPIFHVNADDPEAVTFVFELALEYRQRFQQDVFIDLVGYRRYGHNELDMPKFTQPRMYNLIAKHPPVFDKYSKQLVQEGVVSDEDVEAIKKDIFSFYSTEYERSKEFDPKDNSIFEYQPQWAHMKTPLQIAQQRPTGVELDWLKRIGEKICTLPESFQPHPTIGKTFKARLAAIESGEEVDFGLAENLCYGSLLADGFHVRLAGQDVQRGTFSHRHAVLHDQTHYNTYNTFSALKTPHSIEIGNSLLSEYAAMGFEVGYAMEHPDSLVIWEAQFGDFANGAQIIIDQFISSGETKWGRQCGLTLMLPHGYDGQGPEHSSARLERFLQMCDDREDVIHPENWDVAHKSVVQQHNVQVVMCSTPANVFHCLRRQVHRDFRKPLVMFNSKRILRLRAAYSKLADLGPETRFLRYIPENHSSAEVDPPENIERVIVCSGQVYYDLKAFRQKQEVKNVAVVRVEQLSPFPYERLIDDLQRYPNMKSLVWAQEEPMNMGAWTYTSKRLENSLRHLGFPNGITHPIYAGRDVAASPAAGDGKLHQMELATLVEDAFNLERTTHSWREKYLNE
uniref:2-oxoglutarate dehydrogenase, mitochondrial n=1 Tax=Chromera velia CCMP2878 TaxID=1169474 RepID=A0A0G4FH86_9ALVE|eukprot:Cvel_17012.t1-p1 / transcript=Cvel_17012.t1 / gene=Cvel_17012 / organism=Chromera_velia_CCMP2878 / gene_product=2-oxoglutarate dehydrogenase, mitochondrial, putative / transcript_product=2-oxoglutarate dehydrogenase, mitochondrial, putative / location=Cvel_scaffold1337:19475-41619(-) / protein_length=1059 / sequence_SO=supercontig / SO=protein_coding / is_pseudo=false